MKTTLCLPLILFAAHCLGQCPFPVSLNIKYGACIGSDTLYISAPGYSFSKIAWYNGSIADTSILPLGLAGYQQYGLTVAGGNGQGSALNQFTPFGVYVDKNGYLYVADKNANRVLKFPPGSTSNTNGVIVAGGNGAGNAANQFNNLAGVFVDSLGNIYAADAGNARIQKFPPNANSSTAGVTLAGGNGIGNALNQLSNPTSVCVDDKGNIYVGDGNNARVLKFPPSSTSAASGVIVAGGNGKGNAANQLNGISSIWLDGGKNLFVADYNNMRIQRFPAGSGQATDGRTVAGGNGNGTAGNQLPGPSGVCVDNNGFIYVSDEPNHRALQFPPNSLSSTVAETAGGGRGAGNADDQLDLPSAIYADSVSNVYVADMLNYRIQKFLPAGNIDTIFIPKVPGTYTAVVTNVAGCTVKTAPLTIAPPPTPTVVLDGFADAVPHCSSAPLDSVHLYAAITGGGNNPKYQWLVNSINAGTNSPYYNGYLSNGDFVSCVLTSSKQCVSQQTVVSDPFKVIFSRVPSASLKASNVCTGKGSLVITTASQLSAIVWQNNNQNIDTVLASGGGINASIFPAIAGNYTAIITDTAGCSVTTNTVTIYQSVTPSVAITVTNAQDCAGSTISFNAVTTTAGVQPVYQWQVNGAQAGQNNPIFSGSNFNNNDKINCAVSGNQACVDTVTSNTITLQIYPLPVIGQAADTAIQPGQAVQLSIPVTGAIASYFWSPPEGLSSTNIANPVASPLTSTTYTLKVTTDKGCSSLGSIKVKVFSPIYLPSAFTPNSDGRNDIFYVLGGRDDDRIRDFSIFNREGLRVFSVENVPPNSASCGWDGSYNGRPQPAGTYVYVVTITQTDGKQKTYKGTVVLLR